MSAQDLADETERLGYPVSRSQIANYESGRKQGLDVAELLILAAALQIPPALLLFPAFPDGKVELIPGRMVDTGRAVRWLSGNCAMEIGSSNAGTDLVEAVGRLASIDGDLFRLRGMMAELTMKPEVAESTERVIRDREEQSVAVKASIERAKAALWGDPSEELR
jgi:transcriptional regulator with XRE-family HTH domain